MSSDRRYALLQHRHTVADFFDWELVGNGTLGYWDKLGYIRSDGVMEVGKYIDFHETDNDADDFDFRIYSSGGVLTGTAGLHFGPARLESLTSALPSLGYHDASTALSLRYSGDPLYGLAMGVLGSGIGWIQSMRADATATAYDLTLQPLGGGVLFAKQGSNGYLRANAGSGTNPGYLEMYTGEGTRRAYLGWNSGSGDVQLKSENGWGLDIWAATNLALNFSGTGNTYIGNSSGVTNIYGDASILQIISSHSTTGYAMLYVNGGGTLRSYWYTDASGYGFLGGDGSWDILVGAGTSDTTFSGSVSIPAGYGYYLNGMYGTDYLAQNTTSSYTSFRIGGSKGGYSGFYAVHSGVAYMFDGSGNGGPYYEGAAKWYYYYVRNDDCFAFGGTTTSGSYRLYVTGNAYATGTWTASDERKKRDIQTIPYALDRVCAMRGVEYRWRPDSGTGQDPEPYHVGLIAQEVECVVPEAVLYAADADSYAVDYSGLVGLLIQAVKELKEELDEFKAKRGGELHGRPY